MDIDQVEVAKIAAEMREDDASVRCIHECPGSQLKCDDKHIYQVHTTVKVTPLDLHVDLITLLRRPLVLTTAVPGIDNWITTPSTYF